MRRQTRDFVRAILPIIPLAFCHGCGGGSSDTQSQPASQAPAQTQTASAGVNRAPTISGQASDVARVGQTYDYQPSASDPDGDTLRFTAINLPPWASIDPTSGRITGTPGENDLGTYEAITITVTDAAHEAVSAPFSITVVGDVGSGVASLQWETPPSKCDGSPLNDLAGYRIVYGRSTEDLDHSVFISDPNETSYDVSELASGIWYFAVIAVNAAGLEGPPTTVATKSI